MTAELCDVPGAATTRGHKTRGQLNTSPRCSGGAQCQRGLGGWANRYLNSQISGKTHPALFSTSRAFIWGSCNTIREWVGMWTMSVYLPRHELLATGSWPSQVLAQPWFDKFYLVFMLSWALPSSAQRCTQQMLWLGAEIPTNWPGFSTSTFLSSEKWSHFITVLYPGMCSIWLIYSWVVPSSPNTPSLPFCSTHKRQTFQWFARVPVPGTYRPG